MTSIASTKPMEAGAAAATSALPLIKKLLPPKLEDTSEFRKQGEILLAGSLQ
jgi:hypothetical protein